jgi:hypothetical protein
MGAEVISKEVKKVSKKKSDFYKAPSNGLSWFYWIILVSFFQVLTTAHSSGWVKISKVIV